MKSTAIRLAALAIASALVAAPSFAKDEGKHADKQEAKREKREAKEEAKREKREAKAERRDDRHADDRRGRGRDDVRPGAYFDDRHRDHARRYYTEHYGGSRGCPPGLAKKNNGCLPPGQARKWNVGEPIPRGVVVYEVPRPVLVQLPPPPYGYRYARVGGDIVLVRNSGNIVVDIMINVFG